MPFMKKVQFYPISQMLFSGFSFIFMIFLMNEKVPSILLFITPDLILIVPTELGSMVTCVITNIFHDEKCVEIMFNLEIYIC